MRKSIPVILIAAVALVALRWLVRAADTSPPDPAVTATSPAPPAAPPRAPRPAPARPASPEPRPEPATEPSPLRRSLTPVMDHRPATDPEPDEPPEHVTVWPVSRTGIDGAVREVMPDILGCYQEALAEVPDLDGRLVVGFTIADSDGLGRVRSVAINEGDLEDGPMEDCLLDVMSVLQFDPPEDGGEVAINYPFLFATGDD